MVEKVGKRIFIDKDKWDTLDQWGYKPSEIFELAADILLSDDMDFHNHKLRIHHMKNRIVDKERQLEFMKRRIEDAQIAYEKSLSEYNEMKFDLDILTGDYEDIKESLDRSRIIGKINEIAIRNDFNIITTSQLCKKWIDMILKYDDQFDIEEHIVALKRFLNT